MFSETAIRHLFIFSIYLIDEMENTFWVSVVAVPSGLGLAHAKIILMPTLYIFMKEGCGG